MRLEKDLEIRVVMGVVGNSKSWKHFPIPRLSRYNNTKPYSSSKFFVHTYNTSIQQQQQQ